MSNSYFYKYAQLPILLNYLMKNAILLLSCFLVLSGCQEDYYYLTHSDFQGITLQSSKDVYKMNLKVKAISTCPSILEVTIRKTLYKFNVQESLDTIISRDWYQDPLYIQVHYDSCIVEDPIIGIRFAKL